MPNYTASCNPPKGKKGYTISFRHPVVRDKDGKYGLKIHRGLGTSDAEEATRLTSQLNELSTQDFWWDVSKKQEAYKKYDANVVDIFYDPMEGANVDEVAQLNKIKMPEKAEGFSKVAIVGPSGAGKTSLVRLLCGTSKEKFPTTSTGRTTTCNMQLILSESPIYEAVITFMPRGLLEMYIQECIENAFQYIITCQCSDISREIVSDKLLIHPDLIVRLSYLLGDLSLKLHDDIKQDSGDYDDYDEIGCHYSPLEDNTYEYVQDVPTLMEQVNSFIDQVIALAQNYQLKSLSWEDEDIHLEENEDVLSLRDDMVNEIQQRFNLLIGGEKLNSKGKWVNAWYYKTDNRKNFIKVIKRFSSNAKSLWGSLLTPIVRTMRIKGPFKPESMNSVPKLVLFDGQGLGHKTTATSIPLETLDQFKESESVILVDNAQAPVLDNVKLALKSIIELGYASKLLIAFTHIDLMKGDNFIGFNDKRKHVIAALSTYLMELRKQNQLLFSNTEEDEILHSCYYFSEMDQDVISKITQNESGKLLQKLKWHLENNITTSDIVIEYDAMTLYTHLQMAIKKYRKDWGEIIGYPSKYARTEHWSRIKALTRRLSYFGIDHYNQELMPLADFAQELREQLNLFFNKPLHIMPDEATEEVKVALINTIKGEANGQLLQFIKRIMWQESTQLKRWEVAYQYAGRYSTYYRAAKINEILELATPQIDSFAYNMTGIQRQYIMDIMGIVESVIISGGGSLKKFEY